MRVQFIVIGLCVLVVVACGAPAPTAAPAASAPTVAAINAPPTIALATAAPVNAPPTVAPTVAAPSPATSAVEYTSPEGEHVLGKPDAKVTLIDYSDFL